MDLRPYQIDAINRLRLAMAQGARRSLLVAPTGSGKTVILGEIARRGVDRGRRILWLAHRAELIEQAADTLTSLGLTVGARCASSSVPPNPFALVQVASVQTLLARGDRPDADIVIADEGHHFSAASEEWCSLLTSYREAWIIGATATPERGDGCGLRDCFDTIVVGATVRQLTEDGHLVPCEVMRPDKPLEPGKIAQNPIDAYVEHAPGRRAIVFCKSVQLSDDYAAEFNMRGIAARSIHADTPWAERRLYIDAFRRGTIQVLTNVYVLTEGFDAPELSCVILARGCGSPGMYLQMIGRALRPAPGKVDAILLDLRGVSHEHGRPEDDRSFSLDGRGIRLSDPQSYCPVCGAPRVPPEACAACGYAPSGEESGKPDRVTGDRLVKYARKRQEDESQRAITLAKWITVARAKGYKDGWVRAKYRAVYGNWPSAALIDAARGAVA
jgi:superfamily II DNA or RNA helicase